MMSSSNQQESLIAVFQLVGTLLGTSLTDAAASSLLLIGPNHQLDQLIIGLGASN